MKHTEDTLYKIFLVIGVIAFSFQLLIWDHDFQSTGSQQKKYSEVKGDFEMLELKEKVVIAKPKPKALPKKKIKKIPKVITNPTLQKVAKKEPQTKPKKVRRRVYGLKKVYSQGLGSGGGGANAVVAKIGNSIDVPVDTIKATQEDLQGDLVSVTKVSTMPRITTSAKPQYTQKMKKEKISGKVTAKILVDIDGLVKQIVILKDLGFGTKEESIKAIKKIRFNPATIDGQNIAVWIPLTFRFELQA